LNKHLYLLSIISLIAKLRKSVYYKVITWIIKIVLIINLTITSGLFFSVVDLSTPLNTIYLFYNDLLGPYIDILKLIYYDVNSLYSKAMLNPMPYEILNKGKVIYLTNRILESFFGFCEAQIICPDNMLRPVLPFQSRR
jgi:hypothetical protein